MEEIRENYEHGLFNAIAWLGEVLSIEEGHTDRHYVSEFKKVYGYLTAGMYAEIISIEEFKMLSKELRRWQFS